MQFQDENISKLDYAFPCDNYIESIFNNPTVKYSLKKIFNRKLRGEITKIIESSIEISLTSFPKIYRILLNCCSKLGVHNIPQCYLSSKLKGINSLTIGDEGNAIILVSPLAAAKLNGNELSFIIGHELGHIVQQNLICHTIKGCLDHITDKSQLFGPIIADVIDVPLNNWHRCSEYTADRAGLICCEQLSIALNVFEKLKCEQLNSNNVLDDFNEMSSDHPTIENRMNELKKFNFVK